MQNALYFIVKSLVQLYLLVLLLRIWLPVLRVDFRNPVAQGILRLTSPLVVPVRRFVPALGRVDTATVLVALLIQIAALYLLAGIRGIAPPPLAMLLAAVLELILLSLRLFSFAILLYIIIGWIAPGTHNPAVSLLHGLTEPVLRPFRQVIPAIGGLDISPVFAIIGLQATAIFLESLKVLRF